MTAIEISTAEGLHMPKYVYIQMYAKDGAPNQPIRIRADKVEKLGGHLLMNLGNEQIGEFNESAAAGWWIQDEEEGAGSTRPIR